MRIRIRILNTVYIYRKDKGIYRKLRKKINIYITFSAPRYLLSINGPKKETVEDVFINFKQIYNYNKSVVDQK